MFIMENPVSGVIQFCSNIMLSNSPQIIVANFVVIQFSITISFLKSYDKLIEQFSYNISNQKYN